MNLTSHHRQQRPVPRPPRASARAARAQRSHWTLSLGSVRLPLRRSIKAPETIRAANPLSSRTRPGSRWSCSNIFIRCRSSMSSLSNSVYRSKIINNVQRGDMWRCRRQFILPEFSPQGSTPGLVIGTDRSLSISSSNLPSHPAFSRAPPSMALNGSPGVWPAFEAPRRLRSCRNSPRWTLSRRRRQARKPPSLN